MAAPRPASAATRLTHLHVLLLLLVAESISHLVLTVAATTTTSSSSNGPHLRPVSLPIVVEQSLRNTIIPTRTLFLEDDREIHDGNVALHRQHLGEQQNNHRRTDDLLHVSPPATGASHSSHFDQKKTTSTVEDCASEVARAQAENNTVAVRVLRVPTDSNINSSNFTNKCGCNDFVDAFAASLGYDCLCSLGENVPNVYLFRTNHELIRKRVMQQQLDNTLSSSDSAFDSHVRHHLSLKECDEVQWFEHQLPKMRFKRFDPGQLTDELYDLQWHLGAMDVQGAWEQGALGEGVTVNIIDDGLQFRHPDISPNYVPQGSFDLLRGVPDPTPIPTMQDTHGTPCAGLTAARDNLICGVGVAFRAGISSTRLISTQAVTDSLEAQAFGLSNQINDIYSCSWGPYDNGRTLEAPGYLSQYALLNGVWKGRRGLGSVYVWAAGNGGSVGDNCNYDGYVNSRFSVTVTSVRKDMTKPSYTERCASNMVSAPSGVSDVVTTDLMGNVGQSSGDCLQRFGGTSATAPMIAGAIALMLSVNGDLTWRDVQNIIVHSTIKNDPTDTLWINNGAGIHHNYNYGFGLLNVSAAVEHAKNWVQVGAEQLLSSGLIFVDATIPDSDPRGISSEFEVTKSLKVEWVEVVFTVHHAYRGQLQVTLLSPQGTESNLAELHQDPNHDYLGWTFTTVRCWDESSIGTWKVTVSDRFTGVVGTWHSWALNVYGTIQE